MDGALYICIECGDEYDKNRSTAQDPEDFCSRSCMNEYEMSVDGYDDDDEDDDIPY